jgi:hypothetical protein
MFDWTYLDAGGLELGRSERFEDPEAAEAWLSVSWRDLADMGVQEVALVDRTRERHVYRMGLEPE